MTLVWVFAIATFLTVTGGASCGLSSSRGYDDELSCESARQQYEIEQMPNQTPTRRISTLPCELRGRQG